MTGRLSGKVAIITGAARGMGASHARRFVAEGAAVVLTDVLNDDGRLADQLGPNALFRKHDVSDQAGWTAVVEVATEQFGPPSILINNAGVLGPKVATDALSTADYDRIIAINQTGTFFGMQAVLPSMVEHGGGSIVNVSSVAGIGVPRGVPNLAYVASKFAVRGMTKIVAGEYGKYNIRANSIHPGFVETPMATAVGEQRTRREQMTMLRRIGTPEEVTNLVLFLASDEASLITAAEHLVDAGLMAE